MARQWTEQQINAIESTGGSVLVSAAAGSGKTAVLVERVIRMITAEANPVDVDRLLVVTFTRDAAAEMKQRLSAVLNELLEKDPFNPHLLRQSKLLHTASISTIDSFCGDLVKEYFHTLGVSADYRIADNSELELMKLSAMDAAIEYLYNEGGAAFSQLLDAFSGKGGDIKLRETVFKIERFLETQPFPDEWLDEMLRGYSESNIADSVWGKILTEYASPVAAYGVSMTENSIKLLDNADDKLRDKLLPFFENDLAYFANLQEKLLGTSWNAVVDAIHSFDNKTMRAPNGYTDDEIKLAVFANRAVVRDNVKRLKKYFCRNEEEARTELFELQQLVGVLFALTREYIAQLDALKRKRNVLTFADTELLAVKLLATSDGNGGYEKTEQGIEISQRYDAVIVDEFQDVNDVQDLIFRCVSDNERNMFVVGDVKQCIYGFRQAKPQIFVERRESYNRYNSAQPVYPATIILDKNFRSRREVCDAVNFIFSRLMTKETAQITYTREEYLNVGAQYTAANGCETELTVIDKSQFPDEEAATLEAHYIARRIREIMSSEMTVTDGQIQRKPTYGDFAVMLRSTKTIAAEMVKQLSADGIPAYCEDNESVFDTMEVKVLLNILRIIDNPALDIPLLSVLCSPIYGFTPDELAQIRAKNRYMSLYSALQAFRRHSAKTDAFLLQLEKLRSYAYVSTVDELIGRVLEVTSLGAVTCAVNGGDTPTQNLNILRHFARGYESGGSKNLSDFVFYIDRLIDNDVDLPSASSTDVDSLNGVRVLSVHKSKGLEYPFCFLAGTAKKFNKRDLRSDVLIDNVAGLGIRRKSGVCRYSTLPRLAVEIEIERNEVAEELRILYVALTRAREKLMVIGSLANADAYIQKMASQLIFGSVIDPYTVNSSQCILDWMTLCALVNPSTRRDMLKNSQQIALRESYPTWIFHLIQSAEELVSPSDNQETLANALTLHDDSAVNYLEILQKNLGFVYRNQDATMLPQKVSASQIAHAESGDYFEKIIVKPKFLNADNTSAVERGTAHHLFLQYCDFAAARSNLTAEIEHLKSNGALSLTQADLIDTVALQKLLATKLFDRVIASPKLYREEQFTVKIHPSLIYDDYSGGDAEIVMQGAVDLAFEEDGQLVIVDYKTDRVRDIRKLVTLYQKQLDLYREALSQSLEADVKECVICSVALNDYIII